MSTRPLVPVPCESPFHAARPSRGKEVKNSALSVSGAAGRAPTALRAGPSVLVQEDSIAYPIYASRTLKKDQRCPLCTGRGRVICKVCQGAGKMQDKDTHCEWCDGRGTEKCSRCNGCGFVFGE